MSNTDNPSPEQLREEVERTREDLADTVDELAARLDVKSRLHESVDDAKERVRESAHETKERVVETAHDTQERVRETVTGPDGSPRPEALAVAGGIAVIVAVALIVKFWRSR